MKKILVGMSGGVDSSVAAMLLKDKGYEVSGVTLLLRDGGEREAADAKRVCDHLGIEHIMLDFKDDFRRCVTEPFAAAYLEGKTPNPCILCNKYIKFGVMLDFALEHGFDSIATGHYTEKYTDENANSYIKRTDSPKDQSYFLYMLSGFQISHSIFPLLGMNKQQIRELAEKNGLPTAKKKDSQEICFVPDNDYVSYLKSCGCSWQPGDFVDKEGNVLGRHGGTVGFTIGQRKGLGMGFGKPMYVTGIDTERNRVILGDNDELFVEGLYAEDLSFPNGAEQYEGKTVEAQVKIRYRAPLCGAKITIKDKKATVLFEKPQRAVTPGQSAVFYKDDIVLGGGIITGALNN
ncbi:MAG: tRNA 2-thiouridine(34) synthase MnmA [Clostridia bacterium]|nr:tRNA 2-thiouridine(34) synthase MnmA [Clostridia bacterium]